MYNGYCSNISSQLVCILSCLVVNMYQSWCKFNTKAYKLSPSELPECLGGLDMAAQFRLPLSLSWLQVEALICWCVQSYSKLDSNISIQPNYICTPQPFILIKIIFVHHTVLELNPIYCSSCSQSSSHVRVKMFQCGICMYAIQIWCVQWPLYVVGSCSQNLPQIPRGKISSTYV